MPSRSHRTLALFAVSATVGGAAAATASTAAADSAPPVAQSPAPSERLLGLPIVGGLLGGLLGTLGLAPTVETAAAVLAPLEGPEIAELLGATTTAQQDAALTAALRARSSRSCSARSPPPRSRACSAASPAASSPARSAPSSRPT